MIWRFSIARDRERSVKIEQQVERTFADGMRTLRFVYQGVALVAEYHARGETDQAFELLRSGAEALADATDRLGWSDAALSDQILIPIEMEIGQMYDEGTADRLMQAFARCLVGHDHVRDGRP